MSTIIDSIIINAITDSLSNPRDIFLDNRNIRITIYLSYSNDKLISVQSAVDCIKTKLCTLCKENFFRIEKNHIDDLEAYISLKFENLDTLFLGKVRCSKKKYNELLAYKGETINLSAFFYFVEVNNANSDRIIQKDKELLDLFGYEWNKSYNSKSININIPFILESDDDSENPAQFVD